MWEVYNRINDDAQYSAQNLSISSIQEQDSKENQSQDEIEQTQNMKTK